MQKEVKAAPPAKVSDLVVHEWGTFLGMNAADGTALDGMYHEEHALPAFVHGRSRDQLKLPFMLLKGETPVIYFYTKEKQNVRVGVGFPRGIWTQWYPQAAAVLPPLEVQAEQSGAARRPDLLVRRGRPALGAASSVRKQAADAPQLNSLLPQTSRDALWNQRDVDAAFVKTIDGTRPGPPEEFERFLFYRGLGEARLPLHIQESGHGTLAARFQSRPEQRRPRHLRPARRKWPSAYSYRPALQPGQSVSGVIPSMDHALPLAEFSTRIGEDLAARLSASGLFAKEARAMVNTWQTSYFQTEGIRVLFVLPQSWTDSFIPMTIEPRPRKIVRVMVGRPRNAGGRSPGARPKQRSPASPRVIQPIAAGPIASFMNRAGTSNQSSVTSRRPPRTSESGPSAADSCSPISSPTCVPQSTTPATVSQLTLTRCCFAHNWLACSAQVGQESEARAEAAGVLKSLPTVPAPPGQKLEGTPLAAEINAAALEASGAFRQAAEAYAQRVQLLARSMAPQFVDAQIPGFRDWWVGRAYAACVVGSGQSTVIEKALREQSRTIRSPVATSPQPGAADAPRVPARIPRQGESCHVPMAINGVHAFPLADDGRQKRLREGGRLNSPFDSEAARIRAAAPAIDLPAPDPHQPTHGAFL